MPPRRPPILLLYLANFFESINTHHVHFGENHFFSKISNFAELLTCKICGKWRKTENNAVVVE
ncbi:hypothetical protein T4E_3304 [Trichinella pseudospiralis]|uniref:Uncharacterized protein n=1 Tax=Trichinella pseudospiralis TaxID=6337 RepID=A0A0V0XE85_TRIPS|nr:hypothetical protein T4E_3304 [Trichinella pseudospiralis]